MNVAHKNEKMVRSLPSEGKIEVTHITVRQSLFFLIVKLFVLEILAAAGLIIFFAIILSQNAVSLISSNYYFFVIPFFLVIVAIKTGIMIYVVDEWLEDYYEITPREVLHKDGHFFRKEQIYPLKHLGVAKVEQGLLGRIFGYGSITLFNWVTSREIVLYLIHNPMKYYYILKELLPEADIEKKTVREELIDEDEL